MSPSLREAIRIGLCPDRVLFARYGRGLRPRLIDKGVELPAGGGSPRGSLDALRGLLHRHASRRVDVTVVLSSHFVRHALLEAGKGLTRRAEWLGYARHYFEKTYGAGAREWDVRVTESAGGSRYLASAIDKSLLEGIATACQGSARLISVQPYLMTAFNRALRHAPDMAFWFALHEPGRLLLGLVRDGMWRSVRSRQVGARWQPELPRWIEREAAILALKEPCPNVFLCGVDSQEITAAEGYRIIAAPATVLGRDSRFAMVFA